MKVLHVGQMSCQMIARHSGEKPTGFVYDKAYFQNLMILMKTRTRLSAKSVCVCVCVTNTNASKASVGRKISLHSQ